MTISRQAIENVILSDQIVYGVNTGFGSLSSVVIERNELENLQINLIRSHACGIGEKNGF